jgi:hypothetical protein
MLLNLTIALLVQLPAQRHLSVQLENAIDNIMTSVIVKDEFRSSIRDTLNIVFSIPDSATVQSGNASFFIQDILEEDLKRELRRGVLHDDSLLVQRNKHYYEVCRNPRSLPIYLRSRRPSNKVPDLNVEFELVTDATIVAVVTPANGVPSFTHGISFLFFFTGTEIRKVSVRSWSN